MEWGRWLDKVYSVYSIDGSENENVWKFAQQLRSQFCNVAFAQSGLGKYIHAHSRGGLS